METLTYFNDLFLLPAMIKSKVELINANARLAKGLEKNAPSAAAILIREIEKTKTTITLYSDYFLDLEDLINTLPRQYKDCLTLRHLQGKDWAAVAAALCCSVQYAKQELYGKALAYINDNNLLAPIKARYGLGIPQ